PGVLGEHPRAGTGCRVFVVIDQAGPARVGPARRAETDQRRHTCGDAGHVIARWPGGVRHDKKLSRKVRTRESTVILSVAPVRARSRRICVPPREEADPSTTAALRPSLRMTMRADSA